MTITKIKIEKKNAAAIELALAAVNGRAKAFTISTFDTVEAYAALAEKKLEASQLPKAARAGVKAVATPEGPAAKSYKYVSIGTAITLERGSSTWYLVACGQTNVYPQQKDRLHLEISIAQRDVIQAKAIAGYSVTRPDPTTFFPLDLRGATLPCPEHSDKGGHYDE